MEFQSSLGKLNLSLRTTLIHCMHLSLSGVKPGERSPEACISPLCSATPLQLPLPTILWSWNEVGCLPFLFNLDAIYIKLGSSPEPAYTSTVLLQNPSFEEQKLNIISVLLLHPFCHKPSPATNPHQSNASGTLQSCC